MSKGSPPAAPPAADPAAQIQAEAKTNRYNVQSPFGTQTWQAPVFNAESYYAANPDVAAKGIPALQHWNEYGQKEGRLGAYEPGKDTWQQTITLDPSQQRQFDARNQIAETMLGRAQQQFSQLPSTPFAYKAANPAIAERVSDLNSGNPNDELSGQLVRRLASLSDTPWSANVNGDEVRKATFQKQWGLLDPVYRQEQERLDQKLVNQGLPIGSEAYGQANDVFGRQRNQAYENASIDAIIQGAQEEQNQFGRALSTRQQNVGDIASALGASQSQGDRWLTGQQAGMNAALTADQVEAQRALTERQQQYNELAALLGGQQLNPLTAGGTQIDTGNAFSNQQAGQNRQYQGQLAGYNADVSTNNANTAAAAAMAAAYMWSDRRLKRDIQWLGEVLPGINWYAYHYIWDAKDEPIRYGVMADEVERVIPDAVLYGDDGFAMVDYRRVFAGRTVH